MTPQERAALVARLRVLAGTSERGGPLYADDDVSKAADQIEADGKNLESGFFGRMAAQATKDRRIAVERAEVLAQQVATLRIVVQDLLAIRNGDIKGSAQRSGVAAEASTALAQTEPKVTT